jgi:hypothetical protein
MKDPSVLSVFIGVYRWSISKKTFLPGARNIASPYSIHIRRKLERTKKLIIIKVELKQSKLFFIYPSERQRAVAMKKFHELCHENLTPYPSP